MAKLYKRPRSPYWWARIETWEGPQRVSTKHTDRQAARKWAVAEERRLAVPPDPGANTTLGEALELLMAVAVRNGRSSSTLQWREARCRHLVRMLGQTFPLGRVNLAMAERYVDMRRAEGAADRSIEMEIDTLTAAMRACKARDLFSGQVDGIKPVALRGASQARSRWLTHEEYQQHLQAVPREYRDHFVAYCQLGLRHSELYRLEACHLEGDGVWVHGTKTLGAKRWIPLTGEARAVLLSRAAVYRTGPLFPDEWRRSTLKRQLSGIAAELGKGPVSCNDLRRTFCSWLANAGVPESQVIKLMGHTSSSMVRKVYAQLAPSTLAAAIAAIPQCAQSVPQQDAKVAKVANLADYKGRNAG